MVDEVELELELSAVSGTAEPAARVICLFRTTQVFDVQVANDLFDAGKCASTRRQSGWRLSPYV